MFLPEPVGVGPGEESQQFKRSLLFFQQGQFPRFDHPASLTHPLVGVAICLLALFLALVPWIVHELRKYH
jgi:hypothetical protein